MTSFHLLVTLAVVSLTYVEVTSGWGLPDWHQMPRELMSYYRSRNMRRAGYWSCRSTGQQCSEDNKCCSHRDTCVTEFAGQGLVSVCKDLSDVIEEKERKAEGEPCETSHECADLCCREIHAIRQSRRLRCGKQQEGNVIFHNCV